MKMGIKEKRHHINIYFHWENSPRIHLSHVFIVWKNKITPQNLMI